MNRTLHLVVCAAPPALHVDSLVHRVHEAGWNVHLLATPTAATWLTTPARHEPGHPRDRSDPAPRADAVLVAPATFNTLNKWAAGIADNHALSVLAELLAADLPIVAAPCVKQALRDHPAYPRSTHTLTVAGVHLLDPDAVTTRTPEGQTTFDWELVAATLDDLTRTHEPRPHTTRRTVGD
ncbi:flavoprotein [Saccharothrix violaceirubra]|uniref:Flavoprotein domain-containing protein n=1 Tax=Saccharothrix violaceirubra TaxID=413306 RepID=A0A7W7WVB4_9PSEU|nr:flavoprotein [Saccharothrix violaceirubra]MBB4965149.1 hypothetical protein [Saccharothrix violaceirubra]